MDTLNSIVGLFSLILGFSGVVLTFVTFFAPHLILRLAMRNTKGWNEVPAAREATKLFRHRFFSGFTIEVDLSEPVTEGFYEPWMKALHMPDKRASSYYVTIHFNGLPVERELFVLYDGGRNFIPAPMFNIREKKRYVSFTQRQKELAGIVGYDYFGRSFSEVCEAILTSRHNPEFFEDSDIPLEKRLEDLGRRIDSFRTNCSLLKR